MNGQNPRPFEVHPYDYSITREKFDPHGTRIEYRPVAFDLERVALAIFKSTYRSPITLLFPKENADWDVATDIAMTVELVHAIYMTDDRDVPRAAAYEEPEWYLRGMACFTSSGVTHMVPANAFLILLGNEHDVVVLQVLCDESLIIAES